MRWLIKNREIGSQFKSIIFAWCVLLFKVLCFAFQLFLSSLNQSVAGVGDKMDNTRKLIHWDVKWFISSHLVNYLHNYGQNIGLVTLSLKNLEGQEKYRDLNSRRRCFMLTHTGENYWRKSQVFRGKNLISLWANKSF